MTMTTLITGANRGIGLEHVRQALEARERVIAAVRMPAEATALHELAKRFEGLRIEQVDMSSGVSIDAFAERLGDEPIDLLLNNAGLYGGSWATDAGRQTFDGMDYDLWDQIMRVNVIAPFRLTARLVSNLEAGTGKLVVMMSSDLGSITNNLQGQSHAYRSSKAALNMVTRGLAVDLEPSGIKIVSLAPGWTRTDLGGEGAKWDIYESVRRQRQVLDSSSSLVSGTFINLDGQAVPW